MKTDWKVDIIIKPFPICYFLNVLFGRGDRIITALLRSQRVEGFILDKFSWQGRQDLTNLAHSPAKAGRF